MAETVENEGAEEVNGLVLFQYFLFYFKPLDAIFS
jgi:hypothetical protein